MGNTESAVREFVVKFNDSIHKEALERLNAAYTTRKLEDESLTVELWAKEVYTDLRKDPENVALRSLNRDRRICLSLLYDLVRAWEKCNFSLEFETAIDKVFGLRRILDILSVCLPMDRAQSLYRLLYDDQIGKPWFSELHLEPNPSYTQLFPKKYQEWEKAIPNRCVQDPTFTPPMNKKLFRLIYSPVLGLFRNKNIARWAEPKDVEHIDDAAVPRPIATSQPGNRPHLDSVGSVNSTPEKPHWAARSAPPEGKAALMFTDIQGSTRIWEEDRKTMLEALKQHDTIMRRIIGDHQGHVTTTEGDAFHVAFHDPVDAVACSLKMQEELFRHVWSPRLLNFPEASDEDGFKGLRVRIAIGYGDVDFSENKHGRRKYRGPAYHTAKALEDMAHGGQILVSGECWNGASAAAATLLCSPQVVDLGTHVLREENAKQSATGSQQDAIVSDVVQLVPSSLAHDVSITNDGNHGKRQNARRLFKGGLLARSRIGGASNCGESSLLPFLSSNTSKRGRLFPEPETKKLGPSYFDAPHDADGKVALLFINTSEVKNHFPDELDSVILPELSRLVESLVNNESGYFCKEFMAAFPSENEAVKFGLSLQEHVSETHVGNAMLKGLLKVGLYFGMFDELAPDKTTGRADYQGPVANRASRVASAAKPGAVYLGSYDERNPTKDQFDVIFARNEHLKGILLPMPLYSCQQKFHSCEESHDQQ